MKLVLNRKTLPNEQQIETTAAFNAEGELMIYDYILPQKYFEGDTAVTPAEVMNFMQNAPADLTVRINSSGGEVGSALAIYNQLLEHRGTVTTIVDGYAFSSAGWLALAGSNRQICNGSLFMMHNPYMYEKIDSAEAAQNAAKRWEAHRDSIKNIFTSRTSLTDAEVVDMMNKETYLSANEAVSKGLFHSVRNGKPETAMLNCLEIPREALNKAQIETPDLQSLRMRVLNVRKNLVQ